MEKVAVPARAGRLIKAVASIGYDPEVALCDLMDNSIDAGAGCIAVFLHENTRRNDGLGDLDGTYMIVDDGLGMERDELIKAFTLGSQREYTPGSLGKFGIGLKSAGLSLGHTITIISKAEGESLMCAVLSIADIEASGEYRIDLGDALQEHSELWERFAVDKMRGTILLIGDLVEQPEFSKFIPYFRRYCSNTYHMLLEDAGSPLSISINGDALQPTDPLFLASAKENGPLGNPAEWDGTTVRLLLDNHELQLDESTKCVIAASHLVHPPSFATEGVQKEKRDYYQIEIDPYTKLPRHGFYVYRNRRIIVMAERFHGLIPNQTSSLAFRGRLMFTESADEILALDVKKRHMRLPKGARNNLKNLIANYQGKSSIAWKEAGRKEAERKSERKDELANESISTTPVPGLDYAPGTDLSSEESITARKDAQNRISGETLSAIQDKAISKDVLNQHARDRDAVVPVEGLRANAMWLPYPAVELGKAETLINKSHTWIAEALSAAEKDPRIALILFQIFTILARAELEVRSTPWPDLPPGAADRLLERFRRKASAIGEDLAETLAAQLHNAEVLLSELKSSANEETAEP